MREETEAATELTDEELSAIVDAVQSAVNTIYEILKPILKAAEIALDYINGIWGDFMRTLNPKVQHLALHAKSERARKKNRKRMWLEFQRYCKEVQNEKKMLSMPKEV